MTKHDVKVVVVFGTRPEAIKLAPVVLEMRRRGGPLVPRLLATGQHRDLVAGALDAFDLVPDVHLDVMTADQPLSVLAGRMLTKLDEVLLHEQPEVVLVQGDTTTTLCGAVAALHRRIPVGHVEAGLRTGDPRSPFPEEVNRRLVAVATDFHFAPTPRARENLLREGIPDERVLTTGNTAIDALFTALARPCPLPEPLNGLVEAGRPYALATLHRRESFGPDLEAVCLAVRTLLERVPALHVVLPVHPNPVVQATVPRLLGRHPRCHLVEPMAYHPFAHALARARFVITDSGGIQEEAPALGRPVIVVRRVTERPEAVAAGNARLVGPDADAIVALGERLTEDGPDWADMATPRDVYGDGRAAVRIVDFLERRCRRDPGTEEAA